MMELLIIVLLSSSIILTSPVIWAMAGNFKILSAMFILEANAVHRGLLSPEARNILTIENAEYTWGLEHSLELVEHCALVLDIHHHWIHSKGEYIEPDDKRIRLVKDSWRGIRPVIHYSVSREDVLVDHTADELPDYKSLTSMGFTSAKLRAHSDYYWNNRVNELGRYSQ